MFACVLAIFLLILQCLQHGMAAQCNCDCSCCASSHGDDTWHCCGGDMCHCCTFPKSIRPTTQLYTLSEHNRTPTELLCIDSLSGYLARTEPAIYRVSSAQWKNNSQDSYSVWLMTMWKNNVNINNTYISSPLSDIVQAFTANWSSLAPVLSYVRCNATDESVSVAITLASASESLLLIAGDEATAQTLAAMGAVLKRDLRGTTVDKELDSIIISKLRHSIYVFQNPSKSQFMADFSIYARASNMIWNSKSVAQALTLNQSTGFGAAFGWGPENDYVTRLNEKGIWVHASDYNKNFPALLNYIPEAPLALTRTQTLTETGAATARINNKLKHTVSFLMSDGDNLQWTLGPFSTSTQWFGSVVDPKLRGTFAMGWTLSPAIADLAPAAMEHILSMKSNNDELVAGPSGYGYNYPTTWPASKQESFASISAGAMHKFDMKTLNVLGQNDDPPNCKELQDLMERVQDGLIFYSWGDGYSGFKGKVFHCADKVIMSGKYSLWGNSTDVTSDMVGVTAMIAKLLKEKRNTDPTLATSYTLIPVHAWSHTLQDVLSIVNALSTDDFEIVLPSTMLHKIKQNVI